jgi:alpha-tubulin suppressor-like RCC1 family protein
MAHHRALTAPILFVFAIGGCQLIAGLDDANVVGGAGGLGSAGGAGGGTTRSSSQGNGSGGSTTSGSPTSSVGPGTTGGLGGGGGSSSGDTGGFTASSSSAAATGGGGSSATGTATGTGGGACTSTSSVTVGAVAAGASHTCAAFVDATHNVEVFCWGDGSKGQLGASSGLGPSPQKVDIGMLAAPDDTVHLAAGDNFTCLAANKAMTVTCWGANERGQTDQQGHATSSPLALATRSISAGVMGLTAGSDFACATLTDGSLVCWGAIPPTGTAVGQTPVDLTMDTAAAAAGGHHVCYLHAADQFVYCFGDNTYHQCAGPAPSYTFDSPHVASVLGSFGSVAFALGEDHSCVAAGTAGGAAWTCWGQDLDGQCTGVPGAAFDAPPSPNAPSGATAVVGAAGGAYTCVVDAQPAASPKLRCWGVDMDQELGANGGPAAVVSPLSDNSAFPATSTVLGITAGGEHGCMWSSSDIRCWGSNADGECMGNTSPSTLDYRDAPPICFPPSIAHP